MQEFFVLRSVNFQLKIIQLITEASNEIYRTVIWNSVEPVTTADGWEGKK